jgi:hypothetical protein
MTAYPMLIESTAIVVPARIAAALAPSLAAALATARRSGAIVAPEVVATIEEIVRVGRVWRDGHPLVTDAVSGTPGIPPAEVDGTMGLVDVATAAKRLGIGERAVRGRCQRGTLPAEFIGGRWFIAMEE